ncbi:MAG: hypothetical protein AAFR65_01500 [Pseudomonadota bacterium]
MRAVVLILLSLTLVAGVSRAQSMSPMEADVVTFGEVGAVRAALRNPYADARRFEIEAFDLNWNAVSDVQLTRSRLSLAPGGQTSLLAVLPLEGEPERTIYLCATSVPYRQSSAGVRGQVCGRYRVIHRSF